ncbi:alpha/beta fold hydrolase [Phenylobacterium sp.]|uniref:alpha/beta hydrolase n=1 Tax=Phenylobacterium sp. TaxID=1871053 RepID=UPI00286DD075|nr:alpha/beta fold hydrolase [Phenylobacterium sp.]
MSVSDTMDLAGQARARLGPPWRLLLVGLILMVIGVAVAARVERSGGVDLHDVRFTADDGTVFSGLLYVPKTATADRPAPAILAVHGYINTRETQSAFAIEFARRGYVVLALDQRGHGYSGGAATTKGFGGPEGLAYLRSLDMVDRDQIGLEGHSMGGWAVLAAAAAMPDGYRSMVLEGSSVGAPFAPDGTTAWPRNLAVVFSRYDEFAPLMWGVPSGAAIGESAKLRAAFGTGQPVSAGRVYGDIAAGTGRILHSPPVTHPGDHISVVAVGHAIDWFARTLQGGRPLPATDQIWWWKEGATGMALVGVFVFLLGAFGCLLALPPFAALRGAPVRGSAPADLRWWALLGLTSFIPPITFFLVNFTNPPPLPVSAVFPQQITTWLMIWALGNATLALVLGAILGRSRPEPRKPWGLAALLALATFAVVYGAVVVAGLALVDFRFWVLALKPLSLSQALAALVYLPGFTLFTCVSFRGLAGLLRGRARGAQYAVAVAGLALGFLVLTGGQYVYLFATGRLPAVTQALTLIVAMQFVPVLAALAVLAVYAWRRTDSYLPGALLAGLMATWYMVAGTATHFAG